MIANRSTGSLVSFETGDAVTYGLYNAQQRGTLLVGAGEKVYEGMVIRLERLYARILEDNAASVRFHERMGFVRVPEKDEVCVKSGERKRVLMYAKAL